MYRIGVVAATRLADSERCWALDSLEHFVTHLAKRTIAQRMRITGKINATLGEEARENVWHVRIAGRTG